MWASRLAYVMQRIEPRVSCVPEKRFTNRTACTFCGVCLTSRKKSVNSTFLGTPRKSDFFAGLEEGDQGSGNEPYLKMVFATAATEGPGAVEFINFVGSGDLFLSSPELTMKDIEDVTVGS